MSTHPTLERFTVVHRVIERAYTIEFGADLPVSHEELVTIMQDAHPSYLYLKPEGYEPYFIGRRLVETE